MRCAAHASGRRFRLTRRLSPWPSSSRLSATATTSPARRRPKLLVGHGRRCPGERQVHLQEDVPVLGRPRDDAGMALPILAQEGRDVEARRAVAQLEYHELGDDDRRHAVADKEQREGVAHLDGERGLERHAARPLRPFRHLPKVLDQRLHLSPRLLRGEHARPHRADGRRGWNGTADMK